MILRSMLHSSANEVLCCTLAGANKVMFDLTMYLYKLLDHRRQDLCGIVFNLIHFTETLVPLILLIFASSFQMAINFKKKVGNIFLLFLMAVLYLWTEGAKLHKSKYLTAYISSIFYIF